MLCFFVGRYGQCAISAAVFKGEMHEIYQTENPAVCAFACHAMPVSVYAAGEGNIDNGGGGMGAGTGTNFWSSTMRVCV